MKDHVLPALVLIALGVVLLLDNLGLLAIDRVMLRALLAVWWPALLIATGLGLLWSPRLRRAFDAAHAEGPDTA